MGIVERGVEIGGAEDGVSAGEGRDEGAGVVEVGGREGDAAGGEGGCRGRDGRARYATDGPFGEGGEVGGDGSALGILGVFWG